MRKTTRAALLPIALLMGLIGLCLPAQDVVRASPDSMTVVSDTTVEIVGVYNKESGLLVDLSGSPLSAVRAQEPNPYPTGYAHEPPEVLNSVWDTGTGNYFTGSGADWIWETERAEWPATSYPPANPLYDSDASTHGRVVVFEQTFTIPGIPQPGTMLHITADNCYEVWINGTFLVRSATAFVVGWETSDLHQDKVDTTNWQTVGHHAVSAAMLNPGVNTIRILAGNEYYAAADGNTPEPPYLAAPYRQQNPGAMIFKMDIEYLATGTINIVKEVVGTPPETDWEFSGDLSFTLPATGGTHNSNYLLPGLYSITETTRQGYSTAVNCTCCGNCTYSNGGATIDLGAGDNVTCTFTNTAQPGSITIIKEAYPEDGTDFPFQTTIIAGLILDDDGDSDPTYPDRQTFYNLVSDNYSFMEGVPPGWTLVGVSCDNCTSCTPITDGVNVYLAPGDNVTCTFLNTTEPSTITVTKEVVGTPPQTAWEFSGDLAFTLPAGGGTFNSDNLMPGIYTISETPKDNYTMAVSCTDCNNCAYNNGSVTIDLGPGENVACTFTNTYVAPPGLPGPKPLDQSIGGDASETTLKSPSLKTTYMTVNPSQTVANKPVTITANVVNSGGMTASTRVALKINGQVEQTKLVTVGPGGSRPVKFTVNKAEPGTYQVIMGSQRASFVVTDDGASSAPSMSQGTMVLLIAGFVVVAFIIILAFAFRRKPTY